MSLKNFFFTCLLDEERDDSRDPDCVVLQLRVEFQVLLVQVLQEWEERQGLWTALEEAEEGCQTDLEERKNGGKNDA